MVHTIKGREEWEYLGVLNVSLKIVLTVGVGALFGYTRLFSAEKFVPQVVTFVFYVALPCLVVLGLGINIDMYDDSFLWSYISAFLILRGIALAVAFFTVFRSEKKSIGQVAVLWLALTWISTVILGVPICSAVFNNPKLGITYGILAGISSFVFQLPFQLLFLECHRMEQEYLQSSSSEPDDSEHVENMVVGALGDDKETHSEMSQQSPEHVEAQDEISANPEMMTKNEEHGTTPSYALFLLFAMRKDVWGRITGQVLRNPVLWAIALGFFLTLSKLGPKYLNATSSDFVPGLGWIPITLKWFGDCVSPISLFAMGIWMQEQGKNMFQMSSVSAVGFMVSKLVVTPLIMVGLAEGLGLNDEAGRAAVLIASLPISMASFSLANKYNIGEAVLSENVALGTLLILPTVIVWNLALDGVNIFPIAK